MYAIHSIIVVYKALKWKKQRIFDEKILPRKAMSIDNGMLKPLKPNS